MKKEQARKLARKIYNLPKEKRTQTLAALDTDSRILVVKELYYLRGDAPPGTIAVKHDDSLKLV